MELGQTLDLLKRVRSDLAIMTGAHKAMRDAIRVMIVVFAELKSAMLEEKAQLEKQVDDIDDVVEFANRRHHIKDTNEVKKEEERRLAGKREKKRKGGKAKQTDGRRKQLLRATQEKEIREDRALQGN